MSRCSSSPVPPLTAPTWSRPSIISRRCPSVCSISSNSRARPSGPTTAATCGKRARSRRPPPGSKMYTGHPGELKTHPSTRLRTAVVLPVRGWPTIAQCLRRRSISNGTCSPSNGRSSKPMRATPGARDSMMSLAGRSSGRGGSHTGFLFGPSSRSMTICMVVVSASTVAPSSRTRRWSRGNSGPET